VATLSRQSLLCWLLVSVSYIFSASLDEIPIDSIVYLLLLCM
jgi:hypothetical protein